MDNIRRVCLNVGCGSTPTPEWTNYDNSFSLLLSKFSLISFLIFKLKIISTTQYNYIKFCQSNQIYWANVTKRIPMPDDSVDIIYSSHMIEHLDRIQAKSFLYEAHRVLKPGGAIRLVVPDLSKLIDAYYESRDADKFIYSTLLASSNTKNLFEKIQIFLFGNRHHLWMYDSNSMSKLLSSVQFSRINIVSGGATVIPGLRKLDLYEREDESFYIEAFKNQLQP